MRPGKVCRETMIVPHFRGHKSQRSSPNIQYVNWMRRGQGSKPLDTFLVTRTVAHIVISSTKLKFFLTYEALIHMIEITRLPRPCHQMILLRGIRGYTVRGAGSSGLPFPRSLARSRCSIFGGGRFGFGPRCT